MEPKFWFESWDVGGTKTSFHRPDVHAYILRHLPSAALANKRVLVPLCGKSVDLVYFQEHAAQVIGVELVEKAIVQFFTEQNLPYQKDGNRYQSGRLTMLCADFLELTREDVGVIDVVYDRAALVALPPPMRALYVKQLDALLPKGAQLFINTLEYEPYMDEPPFSITPQEVATYYQDRYQINHVEAPSLPNHRMVEKFQLAYLKEHGFLLSKFAD